MANFEMGFSVPSRAKIKVIGAGGGGGNAVNTMINEGLIGVDFIAINTDSQDLGKSLAERKIQIGEKITQGLGSGGNPSIGKQASIEDEFEITESIKGSDMVFITAGMGGGTGTGSSPIIAQASKKQGALTIGVVTKPFEFEGTKRMRQAQKGIEELEKQVDTLIVIPNQKLISTHKIGIIETFKKADDILYQAVSGISEIISGTGYINVDFADVKNIMSSHGGKALMGIGSAQGSNRAIEAAEMAISSPLLEGVSIEGARGILLNVTAPNDFGIDELTQASNYIKDKAYEDANFIFGLVIDDNLKEFVRMTVIATGIDNIDNQEEHDNTNTKLKRKEEEPEIDMANLEIPTFIRRGG